MELMRKVTVRLLLACLAVTVAVEYLDPVSAASPPTSPGITPNTVVLVPYEATGYSFLSLPTRRASPAGICTARLQRFRFSAR